MQRFICGECFIKKYEGQLLVDSNKFCPSSADPPHLQYENTGFHQNSPYIPF